MRLSDSIDMYLAHMKARGLKPATIKNARKTLNKALVSWGNIDTRSIDSRHIDRLFTENPCAPSTRNLHLTNLKMYFAWCRASKHIGRDDDPALGWRSMRVPREERLRVPPERFGDLLDAARHPRDRILIALGLFAFLRNSEVTALRVKDVDLDENQLYIVRVKTSEDDRLPICLELRRELIRWMNWYAKDAGPLQPTWWLVPAKQTNDTYYCPGKGIVSSDVPARLKPTRQMTHPYLTVKAALKAIGYTEVKGEGGHTLRRSGSRALFDQLRDIGYDGALMRVSSMLGHKDVVVTQQYCGISLERMQRNEQLAGQAMFGDTVLGAHDATVTAIR